MDFAFQNVDVCISEKNTQKLTTFFGCAQLVNLVNVTWQNSCEKFAVYYQGYLLAFQLKFEIFM